MTTKAKRQTRQPAAPATNDHPAPRVLRQQQARQLEQQARQLEQQVAAWKRHWLLELVHAALAEASDEALLAILAAAYTRRWHYHHEERGDRVAGLLAGLGAVGAKAARGGPLLGEEFRRMAVAVAELPNQGQRWEVVRAMLRFVCDPQEQRYRGDGLHLAEYAEVLGIDLAAEWGEEVLAGDAIPRVRSYLELHTREQLAALAKEWKQSVETAASKKAIIDALANGEGKLPKLLAKVRPS